MSNKPTVTFVTGNANKLKEVQAIVGNTLNLIAQPVDLPELQGDPIYVSKEKARLAYQTLKQPCMVEDTSLCFNALNGLPGVYIKWFLESVGLEGLNKMLNGFDDRSAYAQCIFAYYDGVMPEPLVFVGRTAGTIVPSRGPTNFGWDSIFETTTLNGETFTYAEMPKDDKNLISHRYKSLVKVLEYFNQQQQQQQ